MYKIHKGLRTTNGLIRVIRFIQLGEINNLIIHAEGDLHIFFEDGLFGIELAEDSDMIYYDTMEEIMEDFLKVEEIEKQDN